MPIPMIPLAIAAAAVAFGMSQKGGASPGKEPLPKSVLDGLDANIPFDLAEFVAMQIATNQDPKALYIASQNLFSAGYPKASQMVLAACNYWRQKAGLGPLPYPPTAVYPDVVTNPPAGPPTQQGAPPKPGPTPPPGLQPVDPIPPAAPPITPTGKTPPVPGFFQPPSMTPPNPSVTNYTVVALFGPGAIAAPQNGSGLNNLPAGFTYQLQAMTDGPPTENSIRKWADAKFGTTVMTRPQTIAAYSVAGTLWIAYGQTGMSPPNPGAPPPKGPPPPPGGYKAPPVGSPPQPPPPPPITYGNYPTGTHERPDGTNGYYTQNGDYSTDFIAKKFGGTGQELRTSNPGVDWNHNPVGSDLNVPSKWLSSGRAKPGARGPNPPGQNAVPPATIDLDYTNPPGYKSPADDTYTASVKVKGEDELPAGASIVDGQLCYTKQMGDVSWQIVAERFGHKKDWRALQVLNPNYNLAKSRKAIKVPNAWALVWRIPSIYT